MTMGGLFDNMSGLLIVFVLIYCWWL